MISAKPNLNGNTYADFADAYMALSYAINAIDAAQAKLCSNVLHGRNYLTTDAGEDACIDDRRRILDALHHCRMTVGSIASEVADAVSDNG